MHSQEIVNTVRFKKQFLVMSCGHEKIKMHQFQLITASKLVIHDTFSYKEDFMEDKCTKKNHKEEAFSFRDSWTAFNKVGINF